MEFLMSLHIWVTFSTCENLDFVWGVGPCMFVQILKAFYLCLWTLVPQSNISENFPQQPENRRGRVTCLSKMSVLQLCFNQVQLFCLTLRPPMLWSGAVGFCLEKSIPNCCLPIAERLSLQSERCMSECLCVLEAVRRKELWNSLFWFPLFLFPNGLCRKLQTSPL